MPKVRIDVDALYGALDGARRSKGISWRQLSKEVGVSPSLLSRLSNDMKPDAEGFASLVRWLGMPAERFMTTGDERPIQKPDLMAELAPLLRADKDLSPADIQYLEEVIRATVRRAKSDV